MSIQFSHKLCSSDMTCARIFVLVRCARVAVAVPGSGRLAPAPAGLRVTALRAARGRLPAVLRELSCAAYLAAVFS